MKRHRQTKKNQSHKRKKVTPKDEVPEGSTISTGHSSGNNNVLNYVIIDIDGKKIVGSIVNIAAYFHLGLAGICVESVAAQNLCSYNSRVFGAGTVRFRMNLPPNHYTGDFEADIATLLKESGFDSQEEFEEACRIAEENLEPPPKIKYPHQNVTSLLFNSTRVVLIGASNEYIARNGASRLVHMLCKCMGIPARLTDFRIVNIVTTFALGFQVDLDMLAKEEGCAAEYDPISFPAVIMPSGTKMALLVNYTGNCILTGCSCRKTLKAFFVTCYHIIWKCRRRTAKEKKQEEIARKAAEDALAPIYLNDALSGPSVTSILSTVNDDDWMLGSTDTNHYLTSGDIEIDEGFVGLKRDLEQYVASLSSTPSMSLDRVEGHTQSRNSPPSSNFKKANAQLRDMLVALDSVGTERTLRHYKEVCATNEFGSEYAPSFPVSSSTSSKQHTFAHQTPNLLSKKSYRKSEDSIRALKDVERTQRVMEKNAGMKK